MSDAISIAVEVIRGAIPYVIAFGLAGKVVKILLGAIFRGKLRL